MHLLMVPGVLVADGLAAKDIPRAASPWRQRLHRVACVVDLGGRGSRTRVAAGEELLLCSLW